MPFIVRCPSPNCRWYMLLEDDDRGRVVNCRNPRCETLIRTDASSGSSGSGERGDPPPLPAAGADDPVTTSREKIVNCSRCNVTLRIPAAHAGKAIRCPKCKHTFIA